MDRKTKKPEKGAAKNGRPSNVPDCNRSPNRTNYPKLNSSDRRSHSSSTPSPISSPEHSPFHKYDDHHTHDIHCENSTEDIIEELTSLRLEVRRGSRKISRELRESMNHMGQELRQAIVETLPSRLEDVLRNVCSSESASNLSSSSADKAPEDVTKPRLKKTLREVGSNESINPDETD